MDIRDRIADRLKDALFLDPPEVFDQCIVGIAGRLDVHGDTAAVCYDVDRCIEVLMDHFGMDYETALEHFEVNVSGGYVGERSPFFIERF